MNELELKREFRKVAFALKDYCWEHQGFPNCNCIFYNGCCLIEEMITEPNDGERNYLSPAYWDTWILGNEEGE